MGPPRHLWGWTAILGLFSAAALTGCDVRDDAAPAPVAVAAAASAPAGAADAIRSDYVALASRLADPLLADAREPSWTKDLTQIIAEGQQRVVTYAGIGERTGDATMRFIAQEAASAGAALLQTQQTMATRPADDSGGRLAIGLVALWLGNPMPLVDGAHGALNVEATQAQERTEWVRAFVRSRAAQLMLPELARRCSGPAQPETPALAIDIDESFAGSSPVDGLALTNTSGRVLRNCTVLVELRAAGGEVAQNVHFVPEWGAGATRHAWYGPGVQTASGAVGRQTVNGIHETRVSLWSDELRWTGSYLYPGPERDRDIGRYLEGYGVMRWKYIAVPFFGSGKCVDLTLDGVASLPAHTVTMVYRRGGESKEFRWERSAWQNDDTRRFDTEDGSPKWDPESIDVEIGFPEIGYVWRHTLAIPQKPRR